MQSTNCNIKSQIDDCTMSQTDLQVWSNMPSPGVTAITNCNIESLADDCKMSHSLLYWFGVACNHEQQYNVLNR